ncbi:hypothetical protein CBW65_06205 [Tumebacillus avium]|uniref:Na+-translocating membrane potential-generating system MpsC domain-containing protein n=2 Tax=Tumebacillus avium TaxID=1903704 RepID=A0A1Y0ITG3_9BACL|nr:hypothetical protein CBW65_06205 [Tumebacillus avium]
MLTTIGSYVSKLLRDHFGKGPESVFVSMGSAYFNIYIRNFLSPMEKVLLEQEQGDVVLELRQKMLDRLLPELRAYLEIQTGQGINELYYDWDLSNKSGMIFGVSSAPFEQGSAIDENYAGRAELEEVINKISKQAQKLPDQTISCLLNPRTLVVMRSGIMVRIEKEMIRLGHGDLLRNVKRQLEKSYLQSSSQFENILQQQVVDSFVDWHFELDKSVILFVLKPNKITGGNEPDTG